MTQQLEAQLETIRFHNPNAFSGMTGLVDQSAATIFGVSCITGDLEAEGHSLFVDNTTLTQLHELAQEKGKVPVTLDHDGGIGDVNGYLHNFRKDGNKIRADWVLLKSHPETTVMLERAEVQPETFGLSFAFKGDPKGELCGGRACARAEKIMSCDVVKRAAANPDGLFSAREVALTQAQIRQAYNTLIALASGIGVDKRNNSQTDLDMPNPNPAQQTSEPTIADLMKVVQDLAGQVKQQGEVQQQLIGHINQGTEDEAGIDPDFLEALYTASDEDLAAYNQQNGTDISRDEINQAVSDYNAAVAAYNEGQGQEGDDQAGTQAQAGAQAGQGQQAAGAANSGAGAGVAAGGGAGAGEFSALRGELIQLKSKIEARDLKEKNEAEAIQFAEVEQTIALIVKQRDDLKEFAEKCVAKIDALELCVKTGTRPVTAGVDNGVRLFGANGNGELHAYQKKLKAVMLEKKCSEGKAIQFADQDDNGALHNEWLQSLRQIHA